MENYLDQIKNISLKSGKNKIAVIGKGDSIKDINLKQLDDFFIINLNDSEKIIPGDIAMFYRTELFDQIRENGFKAAKYLAPSFFKIPDNQHIEVKHLVSGQDSFEYTYEYFQDPEFFLEDFIILSAIKFSILHQQAVAGNVEVYFIGFDFHSAQVNPDDNQMYDLEYKNVILKTQESFFTSILESFTEVYPNIKLSHVGEKSYSALSAVGFNNLVTQLQSKFTDKKGVTNSEMYAALLHRAMTTNHVIIVAEFTNNHISDPKRIVKMIELAKEAGADIVKFQKRDVDAFYTDDELSKPYKSPFGKQLGDYRRGVELNEQMFALIDAECRKKEIPWFASALDWNSYNFLRQFDTPLIKLPSTISNHKNYLLNVGNDFKGDLVISTGFTDSSYEDFVLNSFAGNRTLFLLQCTSSYPTPPEACQIAVVRHYGQLRAKQYANMLPGYSSHDVGSLGCMLAVASGAKMIEKHVKLGDLDWIHFDGVAIDLYNNRFKDFVHDVRKAELMCGSENKVIHLQEHHKYVPNAKSN
ncbi:N-acetylneuraminate synthase family protein [Mucilaginibacter glaciei]|uniref:N-acetylneuraminate synthase family protein n=1 Tax=Mucilaginibacter glaciei TaxID=2772109 RepID=A0A926NX61_9SPHI|nr:N-acetylneuraminate synthase family protein [Mucilaginibacter glaciei]MBD1393334.1 N-acetylneuraminate synthase family protein [Mucilaginibacter glaciei]